MWNLVFLSLASSWTSRIINHLSSPRDDVANSIPIVHDTLESRLVFIRRIMRISVCSCACPISSATYTFAS
ncbi:hypothetical protein CGRA01v4_05977 [Colletotrichum graminicola]|nr:hypothetical protein CGRA01v4_05977 [Colletotrichum graminicola]